MIKSGRLSTTSGKIAKLIGLKPIITLDKNGKGALNSISLSSDDNNKKMTKIIKTILKSHKIQQYSIVHVNNKKEAESLESIMKNIIGFKAEYITETSSIVAVGAGEGALGMAYILEMEG